MKLANPVLAKKLYLTVLGDLPTIEAALAVADDPVVRTNSILRLARLDQNLAVLRDALVESGYPDLNG
jgi:hypothetical protein